MVRLVSVVVMRAQVAPPPPPPAAAERVRRHPHLVGVSLYAPRLDEIRYPNKRLRPRDRSLAGQSPAFLFELPCSWGALFFRDVWVDFLRFYRIRERPPFYDALEEAKQRGEREKKETLGDAALVITGSRASTWARSWKRFMIDYMHGRGDVMLYPNAPVDPRARFASLSFSTTYMERGDHSGTDGKVEVDARDGLRNASEYDPRKTVPLLSMRHAQSALDALATMPPHDELPVINMFHKRIRGGLVYLEAAGRAFVQAAAGAAGSTHAGTQLRQAIASRGPHTGVRTPRATTAEYEALARIWLQGR